MSAAKGTPAVLPLAGEVPPVLDSARGGFEGVIGVGIGVGMGVVIV